MTISVLFVYGRWKHFIFEILLFDDFVGCAVRSGVGVDAVGHIREIEPSLQIFRAETRVERFTTRQHVKFSKVGGHFVHGFSEASGGISDFSRCRAKPLVAALIFVYFCIKHAKHFGISMFYLNAF